MDVVGHDGEGMEVIAVKLLFTVMERLHDTGRDVGHPQERGGRFGRCRGVGSWRGCLAGGEAFGREDAVRRERVSQAEGHEERASGQVPVWEAAFVAVHVLVVVKEWKILKLS